MFPIASRRTKPRGLYGTTINGAWRIKPRNLFRFLGCFCFYKQRGEEVDERRPTYVNIDDEKQCMWYRDGTWWLGTKNYLNRATGDLYCAHEAAMTPDMAKRV